jgi:hypothetical protein
LNPPSACASDSIADPRTELNGVLADEKRQRVRVRSDACSRERQVWRDSLKPGGRFLPTDGAGNILRVLTTRFQDKKVIFPGQVT